MFKQILELVFTLYYIDYDIYTYICAYVYAYTYIPTHNTYNRIWRILCIKRVTLFFFYINITSYLTIGNAKIIRINIYVYIELVYGQVEIYVMA